MTGIFCRIIGYMAFNRFFDISNLLMGGFDQFIELFDYRLVGCNLVPEGFGMSFRLTVRLCRCKLGGYIQEEKESRQS
jgi:hypothetical protein